MPPTPASAAPATSNLRIRSLEPLVPPARLCAVLPLDDAALKTVVEGRRAVEAILAGQDPRLMAVVGPCSIHDPDAARDYAARLRGLAERVSDRLLVVMRVYFEKPRTTVGWKGLINDPHLDDSFDVATGLRLARSLLIEIARSGLPTATEFLEPITPQYIADTIVLGAIGARTTESPTHRQMASGLSMPVGFKNSTDGSLQAAIDAMLAAKTPHSFLGIDDDGGIAVVSTTGNPWGMLMLRGGRSGSNYGPEVMAEARAKLEKAGLPARIVVDCSHANSGKDPTRQSVVWRDVLGQRAGGDRSIVGLMLESNIHPGSQPVQADRSKLAYGVSVTDACIGWEETESLLLEAHARLG
ncbi:MAG: 3-deoxy-7-phosphoheptulonate synthase [Pirellulales bacterium]